MKAGDLLWSADCQVQPETLSQGNKRERVEPDT